MVSHIRQMCRVAAVMGEDEREFPALRNSLQRVGSIPTGILAKAQAEANLSIAITEICGISCPQEKYAPTMTDISQYHRILEGRSNVKSSYPVCSCHHTPLHPGNRTSWVSFPRPHSLSEVSNPGGRNPSPVSHTPKPRAAPLPGSSRSFQLHLGGPPGRSPWRLHKDGWRT